MPPFPVDTQCCPSASSSNVTCSSSSTQNGSSSTIPSTLFSEPTPMIRAHSKESPSGSRSERPPPRRRERTSSTFSTTSSIFNFYHRLSPKTQPSIIAPTTKALPVAGVCCKGQIACGSFVPNPSAAAMNLRSFVAPHEHDKYGESEEYEDYYDYRGRPRYPKHALVSSKQLLHNQTTGLVPYITRNLSISSSRTASPSPPPRSTARSTRTPPTPSALRRKSPCSRVPSPKLDTSSGSSAFADLHPVLARLERDSRFCKDKVRCSTCGKTGAGFPVCGRCGEMWCSRECRVGNGKRHVCRKLT